MARILVIDDEPQLRDLLQKALTSVGHEVVVAQDGAEGLRAFVAAAAELVIIDLYMNGRDGMETMSDLRKHAPKVPIIAMSGMSLADEMLKVARLMGAKATLKKPFPIAYLLKTVDMLLDAEGKGTDRQGSNRS